MQTESDIQLTHAPLQPPRAGTPGEGINLRLWQEWVSANLDEWVSTMLGYGVEVDQRVATVAATFVTFMGTNCGRCFTTNAERLANLLGNHERGFVAAWAIENARSRGLNHGLRIIEFLLAPAYPFDDTWPFNIRNDLVPEVSMQDVDAVEAMVQWWSSPPAKALRATAEPLIGLAMERERAALMPAPHLMR